jgi:hypothetical protein
METDQLETKTPGDVAGGLTVGRRGKGRPPGVGNSRAIFSCYLSGEGLKIRRIYNQYRNDQILLAALVALEVVKPPVRALCFQEAVMDLQGRGGTDPDLPTVRKIRGVQDQVDLAEAKQEASPAMAVAS